MNPQLCIESTIIDWTHKGYSWGFHQEPFVEKIYETWINAPTPPPCYLLMSSKEEVGWRLLLHPLCLYHRPMLTSLLVAGYVTPHIYTHNVYAHFHLLIDTYIHIHKYIHIHIYILTYTHKYTRTNIVFTQTYLAHYHLYEHLHRHTYTKILSYTYAILNPYIYQSTPRHLDTLSKCTKDILKEALSYCNWYLRGSQSHSLSQSHVP